MRNRSVFEVIVVGTFQDIIGVGYNVYAVCQTQSSTCKILFLIRLDICHGALDTVFLCVSMLYHVLAVLSAAFCHDIWEECSGLDYSTINNLVSTKNKILGRCINAERVKKKPEKYSFHDDPCHSNHLLANKFMNVIYYVCMCILFCFAHITAQLSTYAQVHFWHARIIFYEFNSTSQMEMHSKRMKRTHSNTSDSMNENNRRAHFLRRKEYRICSNTHAHPQCVWVLENLYIFMKFIDIECVGCRAPEAVIECTIFLCFFLLVD